MAKFATHMGDPHGDPQTSPQHADPYGFLVWFSLSGPDGSRHSSDQHPKVVNS